MNPSSCRASSIAGAAASPASMPPCSIGPSGIPQRRRVGGVERCVPLGGDDLHEHVVRGRRGGGVLRDERLDVDLVEVEEVRLVAAVDRR